MTSLRKKGHRRKNISAKKLRLSSAQIRSLFASFPYKYNIYVKIVSTDVMEDSTLSQVLSEMNFIEQQQQLEALSNTIIESC